MRPSAGTKHFIIREFDRTAVVEPQNWRVEFSQEGPIVNDRDDRPVKRLQASLKLVSSLNVQMVQWLIQHKQIASSKHEERELKSRSLSR